MKARATALPLHSGLQGLEWLYRRHGIVAFSAAVNLHLIALVAYLLSALLAGTEAQVVDYHPPMYVDFPRIPAGPLPHIPSGPRGAGRPDPLRRGAIKPVASPPALDDSALVADEPPSTAGSNPVGGISGDSDNGIEGTGILAGSSNEIEVDTVIVPWVEKPPIPVRIVKPVYPEAARRIGLEGTVLVRVLVEKDGRTSRASILRSNNDMFNERAEQAALQWVFVPGMMTGGPVRVWTTIPFRFTLER